MLDIDGYEVTDDFFGRPYVDVDEPRTRPSPHRYIHGGFEGTGTRFSFCYPPRETYKGRFIQPLEGALGGSEYSFCGSSGEGVYASIGGLGFATPIGAYMVESNQGHIGSELCPKGGADGTIYGFRASAESARFARYLAGQIYGEVPRFGYVFGASGGGNRSAQCIEHVHDVWAGAVPAEGGGGISGGVTAPSGLAVPFATMFNAQRVLGAKLKDVVDAVEPGGSGDPFATLDVLQRQALYDLYKSGFPRGCEWMIAFPAGQIGLWAWTADQWLRDDPEYYEAFWTKPGYMGHDLPLAFEGDLIVDQKVRVKRVFTAADLATYDAGGEDTHSPWMGIAMIYPPQTVLAVELDGPASGYRLGASLKILTGAAAGRQLYVVGSEGELLIVDGTGVDGNERFAGARPGDEVLVDNRSFLAFCNRYRHLTNPADPAQGQYLLDGKPIYPQRPFPKAGLSPHMGHFDFAGRFTGKVLHVQHVHDSSIWPRGEHPASAVKDRYVIRWVQNAEHGPVSSFASMPPPVPATRVIDFKGSNEQNLHDLIAWVEQGIAPAGTSYSVEPGGALKLPPTAAERGGIQPVVHASVNGGARADVKVGEEVMLSADIEVPSGAGTIVSIDWDFDGAGAFPYRNNEVDGRSSKHRATAVHAYDQPGTYFPCVRVASHRDGDVRGDSRRIYNLGRARVVVSPI